MNKITQSEIDEMRERLSAYRNASPEMSNARNLGIWYNRDVDHLLYALEEAYREVERYERHVDATVGSHCGTCGYKFKIADIGSSCHCGGEVLRIV